MEVVWKLIRPENVGANPFGSSGEAFHFFTAFTSLTFSTPSILELGQ
jgi:hypothetical protein